MPVLVSLVLAVLATAGFFAGIYALILLGIEGKRAKSKPRIGISKGDAPGTLLLWAQWDADTFLVQIYRFRLRLWNPYGELMEGTWTYTFDPPQKNSFAQLVELPKELVALLDGNSRGKEALISFDFRTVDELALSKDYTLKYMREVYRGKTVKTPTIANRPATIQPDPATVLSLDFQELTARKKRLRDLEAAAKAKAAKAPPPAPPKPATPATPEKAAAPKKAEAEIPSIRSVIAQANAQTKVEEIKKG